MGAYEDEILATYKKMAKQLTRIAECQKIELWFKMENDANDRQKGIMAEVLKNL